MEIYGLVFLLLVSNATLLWASLIEHLVDKSLDRTILKEVEAFRKLEEELTNRNIYAWEAEFDRQLEEFQRDYEDKKCTERPILQKALQSMDDQINRVNDGYNNQFDQLGQIMRLVESLSYKEKGTTLHKNTELENLLLSLLNTTKDGKLEVEREKVILNEEMNKFRTQVCPCMYNQWTDWSKCSVYCGGGEQTRSRTIQIQAINGGDCSEALSEQLACGEKPCPIDCKWKPWTEWGECQQICNPGLKTQTRSRLTRSNWGGRDCDGDATKEDTCDRMADLKWEIQDLKDRKYALEEKLYCDVSKCYITPYKSCAYDAIQGHCRPTNAHGISCDHLPKGLGNSGCATKPAESTEKDMNQEWQKLNYWNNAGIEISGGCSALLRDSRLGVNFTEVFLPGFTTLWGKQEMLKDKNGILKNQIVYYANEVKLFCNRKKLELEELEKEKLEKEKLEKEKLEEKLYCDVSKCHITPYKWCDYDAIQGHCRPTKNGISCDYLSEGLGNSGCATKPAESTEKDTNQEWQKLSYWNNAGIEISGGCSALLRDSRLGVNFTEVFLPGFTTLWGKQEMLKDKNGILKNQIVYYANEVKLFCNR